MSMNTSGRRSRSRRSERSQQLFEARSLPVDIPNASRWERDEIAPADEDDLRGGAASAYQPEAYQSEEYEPDAYYPANESEEERVPSPADSYAYPDSYEDYPSNDVTEADELPPAPETDSYAPVDSLEADDARSLPEAREKPAAAPGGPDLSAYYRRPTDAAAATAAEGEPEAQFAYAPPLKLGYTSLYAQDQPWQDGEEPEDADGPVQQNVYHPRDASWARTDKLREMPTGYQVEEEDGEAPVIRRRRKRRMRRTVVLLCVLAALGGAGYAFREPLIASIQALMGKPVEPTLPVAAIATPAPVKAYDAAAPTEITSKTGNAISRISGSLDMEPYVVTDTSILARNLRPDGAYDFYLFSADQGRLLAYYEGLGAKDVYPLPSGGYYLRQPPYLIQADGSDLIQTADIQRMLGEAAVLEPLMNGWAIVHNASGTLSNYVNVDGQLLNRLWFAKAWPMTGEYTVAYVDTGNQADLEGRYVLYVASRDGNAVKWTEAGTMDGVVASACGAAYLDTGELYLLDNLDAPLLTTNEARFYPDCDAMVVKNAETGKYGLYVHGAQHYDFVYDRIEPVTSDIQWKTQRLTGAGGEAALSWVTDAAYPQPLSHYFLLMKDGVEEYVALSTLSACPVILD